MSQPLTPPTAALQRLAYRVCTGPLAPTVARQNGAIALRLGMLGLALTLAISFWPQPARAQTPPAPLTLQWSSTASANTQSLAWGDVDNDGDLDLAVGNADQPNALYRNDNGVLTAAAVWSSQEADGAESLAWGDVDNDGDLDLAVGNSGHFDSNCACLMTKPNRLYRNDNGMLTTSALWSSAEMDDTQSVAWGDIDGDGDLDLVVGNMNAPNLLYRNDNGVLTTTAAWSSVEMSATTTIALGDIDSDGDLDLAVGNSLEPIQIYRNDNGVLTSAAVWSSADVEMNGASSLAWGDVDNDGDLDLAVSNSPHFDQNCQCNISGNRLYRNENGVLTSTAIWSPTEADFTLDVAWGDVDNDGDLDLAVGNANFQPTRVYRNDDGVLTSSAVWSSNIADNATSVAWGDMDGDGDLDLAVGNFGPPIRLYQNNSGLFTRSTWVPAESDFTSQLAWGDVDGDGDLDLATSTLAGSPNRLYRNDGNTLTTNAIWSSGEGEGTGSAAWGAAWGDVDGDGDLDLAVGNADAPNQLYRNDGGVLTTTAVWSSAEIAETQSVVWGDVDGDGDLDLAVGNRNAPNRLYRNDNGVLTTTTVWSSDEVENTTSVAWGDVDGDGDLDLAVGNTGAPNRLYRNDGGVLTTTAVWSSAEIAETQSVAWGDVDSDGDLDLAVGNGLVETNRLYRNDNGVLTVTAVWSSVEASGALNVAWGDMDGDGDLDLATGGNTTQPTRLYRNDHGLLTTTAVWSSAEVNVPGSVAWGDVDGDGDLDLAMDSRTDIPTPLRLYHNIRRRGIQSVNDPPYVKIPRPGVTDDANFFSTPQIIQANNISITYTLFDPEGDPVARIFPEFSSTGGGQWLPATPGAGGDGLTNLAAAPQGTAHTFVWQAAADLIKSDNVIFRIRAQPSYTHSPILWPAVDGQSPSFRVAMPDYIKVIDEDGNVAPGATLYLNGQPITGTHQATVTNRAGLFNPGPLAVGATLVALAQQAEEPTVRGAHNGWAYRTYLTSLDWAEEGQAQPFTVRTAGEQRLTLRRDHPLVLFNLVVSVEWDADESYLAGLERALHKASDYLFDLSDGQLAFGQVAIYDNGVNWGDADIQIATKNMVRPHAYIGGILATDKAHVISLGRGWDGRSGNQGVWEQPAGYRTLAHEFGHYGLHLYDEYFAYRFDEQGNLAGEERAYCTGPNLSPSSDATNGSAMYYQYTSSEFSARGVPGLWSERCEQTAQWQLNPGESAWETLARQYADPTDPPRWRLVTPLARGAVLAGPNHLPAGLPDWPLVAVHNAGASTPARPLTVRDPQGRIQEGALVALYKPAGQVIGQGFTDNNGQLTVYGVTAGDIVRAASFDGGLAGSVTVGAEARLTLTLEPLKNLLAQASASGAGAVLAPPHLQMRAEPGADPTQVELVVALRNFGPGADPGLVVNEPGSALGHVPNLSYSPSTDAYQGVVSIGATQHGVGQIRALGAVGNSLVRLQTTYRLQQVNNDSQPHDLYSDDGNLSLHLASNSLPGAATYFVVMPPGASPGPLPADRVLVGFAYAVTASGALVNLEKPALVTLRYDPVLVNQVAAPTDLGLYRWDALTQRWSALASRVDAEHSTVTAPVTILGVYALLAPPASLVRTEVLYLPVVRR